jgi:hypothetical protein
MSHRRNAVVLLAGLLIGGVAFSSPKLLQDIPLKWTPTQGLADMGAVDVSGTLLAAKIHVDTFIDTRQDPKKVGENLENAAKPLPVTTADDVAAYVTGHFRETLRSAGVNVVEGPGDITLGGELSQFLVTETNTYRGELHLLIHVKNPAGKEIWSGVILGGSERWGRSYKAENYYETISDTVLNAAHNLLTNAAFHEALNKR